MGILSRLRGRSNDAADSESKTLLSSTSKSGSQGIPIAHASSVGRGMDVNSMFVIDSIDVESPLSDVSTNDSNRISEAGMEDTRSVDAIEVSLVSSVMNWYRQN